MHHIFHIADTHFGPSTSFGSIYQKAQQKFFLDELTVSILGYKIKREKDTCSLVIAGDLWKKATPAKSDLIFGIECINHSINAINSSKDVIVIDGNHDIAIDEQLERINRVFESECTMSNIEVLDDNQNVVFRYLSTNGIIAFDYISKSITMEDMIKVGNLIKEADVAVLHGSLDGVKISDTYTLPKKARGFTQSFLDEYAPKQKLVLMGDIHYPQEITTKNKCKIIYCGSPIPVDYGERHAHGYYIHTFEDDGTYVNSDFKKINILQPIVLEVDCLDLGIKDDISLIKYINQELEKEIIDTYRYHCCQLRLRNPSAALISAVEKSERKILYEGITGIDYFDLDIKNMLLNPKKKGTIIYKEEETSISDNLTKYFKSIKSPISINDIINRHNEIERLI